MRSFSPRAALHGGRLVNLGFTDATRACHPGAGVYTFWDYQAGAFQKDDGIRIDHILLSSQAADLLRLIRHRSRDARAGKAVRPRPGVDQVCGG